LSSLARSCLIAFVVAGMLNAPAIAAARKPIGMVVTAANAHLGEEIAAIGTNIFPGDTLQTDPTGTVRVKVGGNHLYLAPASSAVLLGESRAVLVKLTQGTIGFSSPAAGQFEVETPVGIVRTVPGKSASGEVTIIGPQKILVAAHRGSLVVAGSGVERTINEGDAFNVTFVPDPQGPEGTGTDSHSDQQSGTSGGNNGGNGNGNHYALKNHSRLIFDSIVIGVLAGAGVGAWELATESDSKPH
jgi:hypothetical protein